MCSLLLHVCKKNCWDCLAHTALTRIPLAGLAIWSMYVRKGGLNCPPPLISEMRFRPKHRLTAALELYSPGRTKTPRLCIASSGRSIWRTTDPQCCQGVRIGLNLVSNSTRWSTYSTQRIMHVHVGPLILSRCPLENSPLYGTNLGLRSLTLDRW